MTIHSATSRRTLDSRLQRLLPLLHEPRPHRGWTRAIRDAVGMTGSQLADRLGVSQATVAEIEKSEQHDKVKLETLRRVAHALDCDLVYFFVPRSSLEESVKNQASEKAARHIGRVSQHSRLENQELAPDVTAKQVERLAESFINHRGLWSEDKT